MGKNINFTQSPKKGIKAGFRIGFRKFSGEVRYWREDWPGDAFELVTDSQWIELEKRFNQLGIKTIELFDDDEYLSSEE